MYMSSRLGLNEIPNISWKGKTFNQIVSTIKKNTNSNDTIALFARAQPMKHYRRELFLSNDQTNNKRLTINSIDTPGGTMISSATCTADTCRGIPATVDINLTENFSERPCHPDSTADDFTLDFSQAAMARRRVRSSGVISRTTRPGTTNDMYKTTNAEYLESRGLTFKQNQYNYVKEGSKTAIPGDVMSMNNIYVGNCMSNYPKLLISAAKGNNTFSYMWIGYDSDGNFTTYTVTIPDGYYDAESLATAIKSAMSSNGTYLYNSSGDVDYMIDMYYDSYNKRYVVNCKITNATYSAPSGASWTLDTENFMVPSVIIPAGFSNVIGISAGTYPSVTPYYQYNNSNYYSSNQTTYGSSPQISPAYKPIYYKPNNINYAQQGGVSAGERIARLKYNTITTGASSFRSAYGGATASAYAYNVAIGGTLQTLKSKMGFPNKKLLIDGCCYDSAQLRVRR
jgi:hypothetical protein